MSTFLASTKDAKRASPLPSASAKAGLIYRSIIFQPEAVDVQGHGFAVELGIETGDQVVTVQDGQHVIAPATLRDGFVDFPDIFKIEDLFCPPPRADNFQRRHERDLVLRAGPQRLPR